MCIYIYIYVKSFYYYFIYIYTCYIQQVCTCSETPSPARFAGLKRAAPEGHSDHSTVNNLILDGAVCKPSAVCKPGVVVHSAFMVR